MKEKQPNNPNNRASFYKGLTVATGVGLGIGSGIARLSEGNITAGVAGIGGGITLFVASHALTKIKKS